ncbi:hypothetical protein WH52_13405 [Tenacibaculum holothuriorum]|uniref:Uncharacterized protein n=1 Tax=Tenacibaculum holothuriorum TaxID=1635173 RepID=A0A1Y2P9D3_9FLAO|nr:hypothetical protein [Tenacibaculum holothuriorum]OSY87053.1 hypothetical protein WH52_13405 [Tenacibaculum holothuriorum]
MRLSYLIVLLIFFNCSSNYSIEKKAQECLFSTFPNKGITLTEYIKKYENLLIEKKVLASSSDESYYLLFKKVMLNDFPKPIIKYSLIDSLNQITSKDFVELNLECNKKIESLTDYNKSITFKINNYLKEVKTKNINPKEATSQLLKIYPKDYFSIPLHKLQLLLLINRYSIN